jgi:hypothetical protein
MALLVIGCAGPDEQTATEPEAIVIPLFADARTARSHQTHLTGAKEVPANDTRAQGQAIFRRTDMGVLRFKLIVNNIFNVTQAHIHRAPAGVNGGIVVWLYPIAPPAQLIPGRAPGVLAEGVITDAQVIGSLAGTGVAGLLAELVAGNTYANVHTSQFPPGEIRGQIR